MMVGVFLPTTLKHFLFARILFRVNSREHRDAKIKSMPIIAMIKEQKIQIAKLKFRKSIVNYTESGPRENKVTRTISVLQYSGHRY